MSAAPLIAMDVVAACMAVAGRVRTALLNRKVRTTRDRVRRELEEFCALHGCALPPYESWRVVGFIVVEYQASCPTVLDGEC